MQRKIGPFSVGAIGLGCMPMSAKTKLDQREQSIQTIHQALDAGVTLLDTADIYAPSWDAMGHNEALVAEALRSYNGDKSKIVVATKGGITRGPGESWGRNASRDYLMAAVERSLQQLGVDRIQVWQHHRMDPSMTFVEQFSNVLAIRDSGMVEQIALSNVTDDMLAIAIEMGGTPAEGGVISVQNERSPRYRADDDLLERCNQHGIAYLPWSPLGGVARAQELGQAEAFNQIALARGVTPQVVALAWLLASASVVIPIPGASRPESILNSISAADFALTPEEFAELDASVVQLSSTFPDDEPQPSLR